MRVIIPPVEISNIYIYIYIWAIVLVIASYKNERKLSSIYA